MRNIRIFLHKLCLLIITKAVYLYKIIKSLKRQGEIITTIGTDIKDIDLFKISHTSIANNTSPIKSSSDLIINDDFTNVIEIIKKGINLSNIIDNTLKYLLYYKITELLIIFISTIFNIGINLSINNILLLNLSSIILSIYLTAHNNSNEKIIDKKKNYKWLIFSIINFILLIVFTLIINISNLKQANINNSIILLIIFLQTILLFYYQNNKNSILKLKENWKTSLFTIIYLIIIILIFSFITKMHIINTLIALGYILLILGIIELIKKIKE